MQITARHIAEVSTLWWPDCLIFHKGQPGCRNAGHTIKHHDKIRDRSRAILDADNIKSI